MERYRAGQLLIRGAGNDFLHGRKGLVSGPGHQERMPTGHDFRGDGCHLVRCFPETKYHLGKALAKLAVVIDTGKAQILDTPLN